VAVNFFGVFDRLQRKGIFAQTRQIVIIDGAAHRQHQIIKTEALAPHLKNFFRKIDFAYLSKMEYDVAPGNNIPDRYDHRGSSNRSFMKLSF